MRRAILMGAILTAAAAARGESALDAVNVLPKDQAGRIAKIEGRDGSPEPDRWYILTQDPAAESGVHEFVVSNGEIVASRALSQFAETLKAEDMLGAVPVKIDSDKAAKLAREYAETNGAVVASMNYELKKDGPEAAPEWTISCLDEKGNKVGELVMTAGKGNVVSHGGFAMEPEAEATPGSTPRKKPHFDTYAKPEVATAAVTSSQTAQDDTQGARPGASPKKPGSAIGRTLDSVGRTLHKYLPF